MLEPMVTDVKKNLRIGYFNPDIFQVFPILAHSLQTFA